jgi:hypothetical protein
MARDSKIEDFAEELGKLLGTAEAKAKGWIGQRSQITKSLVGIRDTATRLLSDLGHDVEAAVRRGRARGRSPASNIVIPVAQPVSRRKRRKMSPAARAKIAAAQKARWARVKRAAKK